ADTRERLPFRIVVRVDRSHEILEGGVGQGLLLEGDLVADHAVESERAGAKVMIPVDDRIDAADLQPSKIQISGANEVELAVIIAAQQLAELVRRGIAWVGAVLIVAFVDGGLAVDRRD